MSGKKSVLIIDDDITILTALRKILENDYDISLAKSVEMAWNVLNNTVIDLILLDIEMPNISGFEFMGYLRESASFCYIPVIFVSSHGQPDIILKAKIAGAKQFIVKPVTPDVVLEKVNAVFKDEIQVTGRETLLKKLHLLEIACKTGKSADVEALAEQLGKIQYNVGTDGLLAEIRRNALILNYTVAVEKIGALLKSNLFEKR
jgi:putative two-component system response regulator